MAGGMLKPPINKYVHAYGFGAVVELPFDTAIERVRAELGKEGFGVLTEIDVAATLKKKIDVDFRRYMILGACNPPLAYQALSEEPEIGLLLPCNVIVYEGAGAGTSVVSFMDPTAALAVVANENITPIAAEVKARLERVLDSLGA